MRIMSNSAKFSAGHPLLPAYNFFSATMTSMASTYSIYRFGAVVSLKFSTAENMPPTFWPMSIMPNGWIDQDTIWYEDRPRPR